VEGLIAGQPLLPRYMSLVWSTRGVSTASTLWNNAMIIPQTHSFCVRFIMMTRNVTIEQKCL